MNLEKTAVFRERVSQMKVPGLPWGAGDLVMRKTAMIFFVRNH